ncbi:sigma-54 dependent transcriptional regulator [Brevibacillus agri]|uniref:sigma-54-dependent transcriptional regulator n=1 Tax=Brevibacillus agri TaxID=51101 RepID=UPI002E1A8F4E|nr:sigma-54 dependent transcriptional regulator [Brevibacillus agri]MED1655374.1 sigma-54 dependent transcriptional regulator [Brevibacillus agri]MED1688413.1 sigma-54 dependent transcriptional regulator [Brevibacillus agri]MED1690917.1 sigma-54 dependent transcriptional regulator [Brevibacillus agri]MED1698644.1 sigma-54 dependent transcriptional regulator [Brevibacillus agri]
MEPKRILIVDDETEVTTFFTYFLQRKNCEVVVANTGKQVERLLHDASQHFHAALVDLKLPDADGLELLREIKAAHPACEVLIMTGYSTIKSAVTAMQWGAKDYLEKPFDDLDSLEHVIDSVLSASAKQKDDLSQEAAQYGIVYSAESPMAQVTAIAKKLAKKAIHVLIEGETGTGKELMARFLHGASNRAQQPFVAFNCGAVPESLLESELFGFEKGAFTGAIKSRKGLFELAHNGTLFLDEIGEAPLSIQVKLLRTLETGEFMRVGGEQVGQSNIRFISATNRNLEHEVEMNRFRSDLLYRLEGIKLAIPPLRERTCDIPAIAHYYLQKRSGTPCEIEADALELLQRYDWPGNVRQLLNMLNQTIALHECERLRAEHLPAQLRQRAAQPKLQGREQPAEDQPQPGSIEQAIERECARFVESLTRNIPSIEGVDFEYLQKRIKLLEGEIGRAIIEKGLSETKGDRQLLSKKLNITKRTIRYILNEKG